METRNISIDFDTAKRWYEGGDATLKELAIKAFPELEKVTYDDILAHAFLHIGVENHIIPTVFLCRLEAYNKLNNIALYFNKKWKKQPGEKGYFIARADDGLTNCLSSAINGYRVAYHLAVIYPTVVYFKNKEDAAEAIRLMGDDLQYL